MGSHAAEKLHEHAFLLEVTSSVAADYRPVYFKENRHKTWPSYTSVVEMANGRSVISLQQIRQITMFLMMDCRANRPIRWSQAEAGAKIFGSAVLACEVEMQQGLCEQEVLDRCHKAMEKRIPSAYRTSGSVYSLDLFHSANCQHGARWPRSCLCLVDAVTSVQAGVE
jgi:hypothetical protein